MEKPGPYQHKSFKCERPPDEDAMANFDNSNMIINKMATLYAEKIMSDITLVVGNSEYEAHKLVNKVSRFFLFFSRLENL